MYRAAIRERARDGIRTHGSLGAYLRDFRACSKVFEMFVAERMSLERGAPFLLWEDVPHETKVARGLVRRDLGIDVTDGATTIVQCKLRTRTVTWRECATFFGCALAYADGAYTAMWRDLVLARNACSRLSASFAALAATRPFDAPIPLDEFAAFVAGTLDEPPREELAAPQSLRDYQRDAIELCCADAGPAYVVLPTGTGKSAVIAHVAARAEGRVLVLVPLVVLLEQLLDVLARHGCEGVAAVGHNDEDFTRAKVVVCVFNSAHRLDLGSFERILVDEAHFIARPAIYDDLEGRAGMEGPEATEAAEAQDTIAGQASGYSAVRAAMAMRSARLFSATIDVPSGAPQCTRTLRAMIDAGYLCDYTLHVPVFESGATNEDLAAHLARTYRSMLVFCATRKEGTLFCEALNARGAGARYVDCETPRAERCAIVRQFKSGELAFVVNVRVLSVGFDAPITRGVCFAHMPASQTQTIQMIGRCLRTHPDKHMAHVVLPVVTGEEGDGADVRVRDFMRVLAHSDARFASALVTRGAHVDVQLVARPETEGCDAETEETEAGTEVERTEATLLCESIYDSMGRAIFGAWDARLAELQQYHAEHARIPTQREPLGRWVNTQRAQRETMPLERKAKLDALPWWKWAQSKSDLWDTRLAELQQYHAEHGRVPHTGTSLCAWVHNQRAQREDMPQDRKAKLEAMPWWRWAVLDPEAREANWETRLEELKAYHAEHSRVPADTGTLGAWVLVQQKDRETMPLERKAKLEALPWWKWKGVTWGTRLAALEAHYAEHGCAPAPETALGAWISAQRARRGSLREDRRAKLDALPWWTWPGEAQDSEPSNSTQSQQSRWDARLAELSAFHVENGAMPPSTTPLGSWVSTQRESRETMRADRKERLEALPFWTWTKICNDSRWDARLAELVAYHDEHGAFPPRASALGIWVDAQRRSKGTKKVALTSERRERLEALPWWTYQTPRVDTDRVWHARYIELVAYHAEQQSLPALGTPLGRWVYVQQQTRAALASERAALLEKLPCWKWHSDRSDALWTEKYDALVAAHAATGCVPSPSTKLGKWVATQMRELDTMAPYRKAKLEALDWLRAPEEPRQEAELHGWQERLTELLAYHAEHGAMPLKSIPLGKWAYSQRAKRDTMAEEQKAQLDALAWWRWDNSDRWNARFTELVAWYAEHGRHPPETIPLLGIWVAHQRQKREALAPDRKAKLDALTWWTWKPKQLTHGRVRGASEPSTTEAD